MTDDHDSLASFAKAAEEVMGSDPVLFSYTERPGSWATAGGIFALVATQFGAPWWAVVIALFAVGWWGNEREAQRIRKLG